MKKMIFILLIVIFLATALVTTLVTRVQIWSFPALLKPVLQRQDLSVDRKTSIFEGEKAWADLKLHIQEHNCSKQAVSFMKPSMGLRFACGLAMDSSIILGAVFQSPLDEFSINLSGETISQEPDPPKVLQFVIQFTEKMVLLNRWGPNNTWSQDPLCVVKDDLDICINEISTNITTHFPFNKGVSFSATFKMGLRCFHLIVDGKHVMSLKYTPDLYPSMVRRFQVSDNLKVISLEAHNLPRTEGHLDAKESKELDMFIGVPSTNTNFEARMAIRRTWMHYEPITSGRVRTRFFVGMDKNIEVNQRIFNELLSYGDIVMLPFLDTYHMVPIKALAICIYMATHTSARFLAMANDDTFIRVDEVVRLLNNLNQSEGLLYGKLEFNSKPIRKPENKWYIPEEEWPNSTYPPWAAGACFIVSNDIVKFVSSKKMDAKLLRQDDVSMAVWIDEYKQRGGNVNYVHNEHFENLECHPGFITTHYQSSHMMMCLWQNIQCQLGPNCCTPITLRLPDSFARLPGSFAQRVLIPRWVLNFHLGLVYWLL